MSNLQKLLNVVKNPFCSKTKRDEAEMFIRIIEKDFYSQMRKEMLKAIPSQAIHARWKEASYVLSELEAYKEEKNTSSTELDIFSF